MHDHQAKKNFGQNFLQNQHTIKKILTLIRDKKPEAIVEIGPGLGAFTRYFNESGIPITAIEIDNDLIDELQTKFPNVKIVHNDIMKVDFTTLNLPTNTIVFGSLPYNISKQIIRKLIENENFKSGYFIIQKEVAEKYISTTAPTNKLALLSQIYAQFTKHFDISAGQFVPKPKVTSSLIEVDSTSNKYKLTAKQIADLETLINVAFTHPRKTLNNNLKSAYPEISKHEFASLRPENLTLEQYIQLLAII